jgi:hypothetical protein
MRYPEQQPLQFVGEKQGTLSYPVRKWLQDNDRTRLAVYAPGLSTQSRPNTEGVVNYGN